MTYYNYFCHQSLYYNINSGVTKPRIGWVIQLGVWGRCKPPSGVQGRSPGNFLNFTLFRCPDIEFLHTILAKIVFNFMSDHAKISEEQITLRCFWDRFFWEFLRRLRFSCLWLENFEIDLPLENISTEMRIIHLRTRSLRSTTKSHGQKMLFLHFWLYCPLNRLQASLLVISG